MRAAHALIEGCAPTDPSILGRWTPNKHADSMHASHGVAYVGGLEGGVDVQSPWTSVQSPWTSGVEGGGGCAISLDLAPLHTWRQKLVRGVDHGGAAWLSSKRTQMACHRTRSVGYCKKRPGATFWHLLRAAVERAASAGLTRGVGDLATKHNAQVARSAPRVVRVVPCAARSDDQ